MPIRPPIHRPLGRRSKRECDRETDMRGGAAIRRLYKSALSLAVRWLFLARHPLCAECPRQGLVTSVRTVDHITPHPSDSGSFWDEQGWQPLCAPCHSRKTTREDGGVGN